MLKRILPSGLLFILFIISGISYAQVKESDFELVESVPVETTLEKSPLPRSSGVWLKMIGSAEKSIVIETFYFADEKDKPLEEIITALKNAAARGVSIRIIVDSSFYSNSKSVDLLEEIQNITIKKIPVGNISGGVMHAKYFIVDGENLFIGSQNFDWRALMHIHEIGARVKNKELAGTFLKVFETDWKLCDGNRESLTERSKNSLVNSSNPVTINSDEYGKIILYPAFSPPEINIPGVSSEEDELFKILKNVKDSLLIQMYSYSPKAKNEKNFYDDLDNALREAASRNIKIKIIFSDWSIKEPATDFIKSLSQVKNIEIKFSSIPEYSGGFIPYARVEHCKYFTADNNISWISTSNWEWGYFHNSRNATLIIENEKVNSDLSSVFFRSWNSQYVNGVDIKKEYKSVKRN